MIPDRNKSELTHKVTDATYRWLDEHGFKPVETEVHIGDRWCADLAGVIEPTQTELIDMKMLPRRPSWKDTAKMEEWNRQATMEEHRNVIYSIALRRDHRTRYAEQRQQQKKFRIEMGEFETNHRIGKIVNAVADILRGHTKYSTEPITSIEQAFERYGIRKVHAGHLERLAEACGTLAKKNACNLRAS